MRYWPVRLRTAARGATGCCLAVAIIGFVLALGSCVGLGWGMAKLSAAPAVSTPAPPADIGGFDGTDVVIVLDQSGSLFGSNGRASDPALLRMSGARLLVDYLGAEAAPGVWRIGVVHFGTRARLAVPLSDPSTADGRDALMAGLADPAPEGWTAIGAALDVALAEAYDSPRAQAGRRVAIVLFTDGLPQTADAPSAAPSDNAGRALDRDLARLVDHGAAWITVLLAPADATTPATERAAWTAIWTDVAARRDGRLLVATAPADLLGVYHTIARDLVGHASVPLPTAAPADIAAGGRPIAVAPGTRRMKVVAAGPDGAVDIDLVRPSLTAVAAADDDVLAVHRSPDGRSSIWSLDQPAAGTWRLRSDDGAAYQAWADTAIVTSTARTSSPVNTTPTATATLVATATSARTAPSIVTPTAAAAARFAGAAGQPGGRGRLGFALLATLLLVGVIGATAAVFVRQPGLLGRSSRLWTGGHVSRASLEGSLRPLVAQSGHGAVAQPIRLDGRSRLLIGTAPGADVVVDSPDETPIRAALMPPPAGAGADLIIEDGLGIGLVTVNGEPIRARRGLVHGDDIAVGSWRGRYENVMQPGTRARTGGTWDGAAGR